MTRNEDRAKLAERSQQTWPKDYDATTCAEWNDDMSAREDDRRG